jgi:hypothetical protein
MAVSAVLITTGKRNKELGQVIADISKYEYIDEILVSFDRAFTGTYHRYLMAARAKNDWIYFQDDDCIVKNLEEIYDKRDQGRITLGMKEARWNIYRDSKVQLIGWGAFFHKDLIKVLDKYIEKYGTDQYLMREADRIFTYLNNTKMVKVEVDDFDCATNSYALCVDPEHDKWKTETVERLKTL